MRTPCQQYMIYCIIAGQSTRCTSMAWPGVTMGLSFFELLIWKGSRDWHVLSRKAVCVFVCVCVGGSSTHFHWHSLIYPRFSRVGRHQDSSKMFSDFQWSSRIPKTQMIQSAACGFANWMLELDGSAGQPWWDLHFGTFKSMTLRGPFWTETHAAFGVFLALFLYLDEK